MVWLGAIALIVAVVFGVAALYFGFRLILPSLPALFCTYVFLGAIAQFFGLTVFLLDLSRTRGPRQIVQESIAKARRQIQQGGKVTGTIRLLRAVLSGLAGLTVGLILWPVSVALGLIQPRLQGPREFALAWALRVHEHLFSVAALLIIGIGYGLAYLNVDGKGYGSAFIVLMGVSVALRNATYIVDSTSLPTKLRRNLANPYLVFVFILVCDLASLVLSFVIVVTGNPPDLIARAEILDTAKRLFAFRDVLRVFWGESVTWLDAVVSAVGILFYVALFSVILKYKDFERNDSDKLFRAEMQIALGKFVEAMRSLDLMSDKSSRSTALEVAALLGLNQFDRARQKALLFLQLRGGSTTSDEQLLLMIGAIVIAEIPENVRSSLFLWATEHGVSDVLLYDSVGVIAAGGATLTTKMRSVIEHKSDSYPLTCALLRAAADEREGAMALAAQVKPGSEIEEIVRLCLLLRLALADPITSEEADSEKLGAWLNSELVTINGLIQGLHESIHIAIAYAQLAIVRVEANKLLPSREQEVLFLGQLLRAKSRSEKFRFRMRGLSIVGA